MTEQEATLTKAQIEDKLAELTKAGDELDKAYNQLFNARDDERKRIVPYIQAFEKVYLELEPYGIPTKLPGRTYYQMFRSS